MFDCEQGQIHTEISTNIRLNGTRIQFDFRTNTKELHNAVSFCRVPPATKWFSVEYGERFVSHNAEKRPNNIDAMRV